MDYLPLDIKYKIMSYLPILDDNRIKINLDIIKSYYHVKWCKYYKDISCYSLDPKHDDYYLNWLENDVIFILNNKVPLIFGIDKELTCLIKMVEGYDIYVEDEITSPYLKYKPVLIVKRLLSLLNLAQLHILDKNLEVYNYNLETGHSNTVDLDII